MKVDNNYTLAYNTPKIYKNKNQNINFNGRGDFYRIFAPGRVAKKHLMSDMRGRIASMLELKPSEVRELTQHISQKRLTFFDNLTQKFNMINFYKPEELKESPKVVIDVFKEVKRPHSEHFTLIDKLYCSIGEMGEIFKLAKDRDGASLALKTRSIISGKNPENIGIIKDILTSPNRKEYIKHFNSYKSYLKLFSNDKNVIKTLDELVTAGKFDKHYYDVELSLKNLLKNIPSEKTAYLNKENLKAFYSEEGAELLDLLTFRNAHFDNRADLETFEKNILSIYKGTNPDNLWMRERIIKRLNYITSDDPLFYRDNNELLNLKNLMEKMDKSKHVRKFVDKSLTNDLGFKTATELTEILEVVNPKKANIFFNNLKNIIKQTNGEKRIQALKNELFNPFFETKNMREIRQYNEKYGYSKKHRLSKLITYIENLVNIARYKLTSKELDYAQIPVEKELTNLFETNKIVPEEIIKPVVEMVQEEILPKAAEVAETEVAKLNLTRIVKESPQARKLRVINDVNGIIEKKLRASQLEKQQEQFTKNATAMRLKLLPEIFDSIKETRATDRAVGKLKHNSSTNDAVVLYNKINGKNRKVVKYMLQKRNADKTRLFEVKDIITFLEKADKNVARQRAENPRFRAADEKAYFDHIYESFIQQYGKPTIKRKAPAKSTKAPVSPKSKKEAA